MNGNRYILDTNAAIALLKGNPRILQLSNNAEWIGISIISYIEFLSFPNLCEEDKTLFHDFIKQIEIIDLGKNDNIFIDTIINFRKLYKIKLPDAVIASTAFCNNARLVTEDKELSRLKEIEILTF